MYSFNLKATQPKILFEAHGIQGHLGQTTQGLWHLYMHTRLEDKLPQSWIFEPQKYQPLSFDSPTSTNANEVLVFDEAHSINLSPFQWSFNDLTLLDFSPLKSPLIPPGKSEEAFEDTTDGLKNKFGFEIIFKLPKEATCYGLGERTGFINKRGRLWKNWTTDEFIHTPQSDPLYQAHPFVLIQIKGVFYGLYLDDPGYSEFDLGSQHPEQMCIRTASPFLNLYLIPGPSPKEVISAYTQMIGRAPMPPLWPLGYHQCRWGYPNQSACEAIIKAYDDHKLPLTTFWLDIDHMHGYRVFQFSESRFPDIKTLIESLAFKQRHLITIADPGIKADEKDPIYLDGYKEGIYVRNTQDEPLVGEVWPKPVVWPDFTLDKAQKWWGKMLGNYYNQGVSGIWIDMNEPSTFHKKDKTLPLNARQGKWSHAEVHNLYGYLMAKSTFEGSKSLRPDHRPFVLTRSGFSGIQKYAWVWTGDNHSYWSHLEMSIPMLLNMGLSGMPFIGTDIGGFSGKCEGELLTRWTWLGAFYPFMRNHSGKHSDRQEPWVYGEPYLSHIRKAIEFRYRILPYLYTLSHEASQTGQPILRPLFLDAPNDKETYQISDQFMVGSDLMVAPIVKPGQTTRAAYFPSGTWVEFLGNTIYEGGQYHLVSADLDSIPVFQKQSSAIPLQTQTQAHSAQWVLEWQIAFGTQEFIGQVYCDNGDGVLSQDMIQISGKVTDTALLCEMPLFYPGHLNYKNEKYNLEAQKNDWNLTES